jgi:hypothetical protein
MAVSEPAHLSDARSLLLLARLKPGWGFSPSPGKPGEDTGDRGEGGFARRTPLVLEITLTPTLSRITGRGGNKKTAARRCNLGCDASRRCLYLLLRQSGDYAATLQPP